MTQDTHVEFASLLASRLCHDVVNPAGALSTALDVLNTETDPGMRQHAEELVQTSMARLLSIVEFARVAFGASGGSDGELQSDVLQDLANRLFAHLKADLHWEIPPSAVPKASGRILLNLLLISERLAPRRGSSVTVAQGSDGYVMMANGPRASLPDDVAAALAGEATQHEPKLMPAFLAQRLAAMAGQSIHTDVGEDRVTVTVR